MYEEPFCWPCVWFAIVIAVGILFAVLVFVGIYNSSNNEERDVQNKRKVQHGSPIESQTLLTTVQKGTNFEKRCAHLLSQMGYVVRISGGSGDRGVDIVAEDPSPITGSTVLIQCKDWRGTLVGEPILRALHYAVMTEG